MSRNGDREAERRAAKVSAEALLDLLTSNLTDLHGVIGEMRSILTSLDLGVEAAEERMRTNAHAEVPT